MYGVLMRGRHQDVVFIEFHINRPPSGRRMSLGPNWSVDLVKVIRSYAKKAGFTIIPRFTNGFMFEEI
jgi:hypothetical protein